MDKLTAIKIKYDDDTYSDEIPIRVLSENVEWDNTHTLVDVLGSIDVDAAGTIQDQISQLFNEKVSVTQLQDYVASQLNDIGANPVVVDSSLTIEGAAADAKVVGNLKSDLGNAIVFKYTNSPDLISFIKSIYAPNLTGQIGVCTIVNDTDEIRVNIYNVDDTGQYTSSTPLEKFGIKKDETGVIQCTGKRNSIAEIDTAALYQKILGTSGITKYRSVFNQWVTYYKAPSLIVKEACQLADNALTEVNKIAEICVNTELSEIKTSGERGGNGSSVYRGFRTRIANIAPISAIDIIIGLSAESDVTLSLLDISLNPICRFTKRLPEGVGTYRFDFGSSYSIDGEELFVELFSNAKTITTESVGAGSDYVTADNRTADKGNYYATNNGEKIVWYQLANSSSEKLFSLLFTTYTGKHILATHTYDGGIISPREIYTVQDSFAIAESMPQTLYIDHMVKLDRHEDICFEKTKSDKYFICSSILSEQSSDVVKTNHDIILNGFKDGKSVTIQQISTKSNVGADNPVRLLQIGDSVGGAFGGDANVVDFYGKNPAPYWGVTQKLFDLDGIKSNDTSKYKMQTLGFRNRFKYSIVHNGETYAEREAFGESRGGWRLIDYLYNSIKGETGTDREPTSLNPINPFYDENKVWTGLYSDELNSAGVKFSVAHYLSAYRTHDDSGNVLTVGEGTGTNIHASGTNNRDTGYIVQGNAYINTPTHILQENAFNDPDIDSFVRNTELFIKAVRNEFPNIFIGIVFNDAGFGYFSEYYERYSMDGFMNGYGNALHEKQYDRYNKLRDMISRLEDTKVFLIPTMFIQPTLSGCQTIDAINSDGSKVKYVGSNGTYHPNNVAHSAWGSQLYAWLKYTQSLN